MRNTSLLNRSIDLNYRYEVLETKMTPNSNVTVTHGLPYEGRFVDDLDGFYPCGSVSMHQSTDTVTAIGIYPNMDTRGDLRRDWPFEENRLVALLIQESI